jgi:outer membrane protein assembly factor BamA
MLGGNALVATSASINFPFPLYVNNGMLYSHVFCNAGALRYVHNWAAECAAGGAAMVERWRQALHVSFGIGLVFTRIPLVGISPNGRFEMNLAVPLSLVRGDRWVFGTGERPRELFDRFRFSLVWSSALST